MPIKGEAYVISGVRDVHGWGSVTDVGAAAAGHIRCIIATNLVQWHCIAPACCYTACVRRVVVERGIECL